MKGTYRNRLTDKKNRLLAITGEAVPGWVKKMKGSSKNHTHRDNIPSGNEDYQKERGCREVEEDIGSINGDGRRLDFGW